MWVLLSPLDEFAWHLWQLTSVAQLKKKSTRRRLRRRRRESNEQRRTRRECNNRLHVWLNSEHTPWQFYACDFNQFECWCRTNCQLMSKALTTSWWNVANPNSFSATRLACLALSSLANGTHSQWKKSLATQPRHRWIHQIPCEWTTCIQHKPEWQS